MESQVITVIIFYLLNLRHLIVFILNVHTHFFVLNEKYFVKKKNKCTLHILKSTKLIYNLINNSITEKSFKHISECSKINQLDEKKLTR